MASPSDSISMALFCDVENVALGVRDAQYEKFDIKPILERLLLKGSIVVKKAYCDWERYKGFKATMHEANFELIEIPHVRQSGKNSADIRLVVDALDLCYTKSHVNTFVIISGDSDFSPLVSKLRENNKQVIGVGVKQSTSDLLIANCDEFIFYDDLVRENQRAQARRQAPGSNPPPAPRRSPEEERSRKEGQDARRTQGVELAAETFEALLSERGEANGPGIAGTIVLQLDSLPDELRTRFFDHLATDFSPDPKAVLACAQAYAEQPAADRLIRLTQVAEPPRQELFRRLNRAPGGTAALVRMRRACAWSTPTANRSA